MNTIHISTQIVFTHRQKIRQNMKTCPVCSIAHNNYKFCSRSCNSKFLRDHQLNGRKKSGIYKICRFCEKMYYVEPKRKHTAKYCSISCGSKSRAPEFSKKYGFQPQNKPKRRYKQIKTPDGRHMLEHRWVMEQHLGRKLESWEQVHHIDNNPLNNDLSNLQILTRSEHRKLHL